MGQLGVVPTYWGPVRDYELGKPSLAYDHPSPIDSQGTLPWLLKSLARNTGPKFRMYLVVAPTEPELGDIAEAHVQGIAARSAGTMSVEVIGPRALEALRAVFGKGSGGDFLSLRGYGNVRNLGLAMGLLAGAEAIAFLDDDEVVEPDCLARAAAQGLSLPVELGPYPRRFLGEDLETEAAAALGRHCPPPGRGSGRVRLRGKEVGEGDRGRVFWTYLPLGGLGGGRWICLGSVPTACSFISLW